MKTGLVLGKFLPVHNGHLYLIRFAARHVERLYVVVESVVGESISHGTRLAWLERLCPDCDIIPLTTHMPQQPDECPDFWPQWQSKLEQTLPEQIEAVFASEAYGFKLADILNARFCPLDIDRVGEHISATEIRNDMYAHWSHLPLPAQRHFQSKVCIVGAESVGKSTLARALATHLNGRMVPEYARHYLETTGRVPLKSDMYTVALGQMSSEAALSAFGDPFVVCDTDALTTLVWSHHLFGGSDDGLEQLALCSEYDLTILLEPDVPWIADPVRYTPNTRWEFHQQLVNTLGAHQRPFVTVNGDWSVRLTKAKQLVDGLKDTKRLSIAWSEQSS